MPKTLEEWLLKHRARILWETKCQSTKEEIQCWLFPGGRTAIVTFDDRGFDVWTACDSNLVEKTFRDAEKRLGLDKKGG